METPRMSKHEIATIARRILAREIDPLEGCRWVVRHQHALSEEERRDPDLTVLVAIESETDHFATGIARRQWDRGALAEQDRQRTEYLQRNERFLFEACKALIEKF
jgi:hypothetical protein